MRVMKFGGTSVTDTPAILRLIDIVKERQDLDCVIVVSALSKVTDALYKIADIATQGDFDQSAAQLETVAQRHKALCDDLIPGESDLYYATLMQMQTIIDRTRRVLTGVAALNELSPRSQAAILSCGELLSSTVIGAALNAHQIKTQWLDARQFIITNSFSMKADPEQALICRHAKEIIPPVFITCRAVITQGFIAADTEGVTTVLGRGGSDYSASLLGMALEADEIEIWTDVDGIHTADPRRVANSHRIDELSFEEAAELAHFGAKVLHPMTIQPAIEKNIPVRVLNSRDPHAKGTLIVAKPVGEDGAKSISCKENILVINVFSTKMIHTYGFLSQLFDVFNKHHVSVDLISTSEANVSLTLEGNYVPQELIDDLSTFSTVNIEYEKSQVSLVGRGLKHIPGFCERVFGTLKDFKILMISQGASAINTSFVVERKDLNTIMQLLHKTFFETPNE